MCQSREELLSKRNRNVPILKVRKRASWALWKTVMWFSEEPVGGVLSA
jgi:hypothetical protein